MFLVNKLINSSYFELFELVLLYLMAIISDLGLSLYKKYEFLILSLRSVRIFLMC